MAENAAVLYFDEKQKKGVFQYDMSYDARKVARFFEKMSKNVDMTLDHHRNFWSIMSTIAFADVIDHFEKERGPEGKWDEWSDLYRRRMQKLNKASNKILQDNGRLRNSTLFPSSSDRVEGAVLINPAKTKKGFPYAKHHDEDRSSYKGNPRSFFWLSQKAKNKMVRATLHWIKTGRS